ncbi:MAG TPA: hypothetical protein VL307_02730 [Chitinophagaceae bacterium]|nr:hypothetical protein [Chitinophagaceae bacterium]
MPLLTTCLYLLLIAGWPALAKGQKIKYADSFTGYNVAITGMVGKYLHVWSGTVDYSSQVTRTMALRLQLFTPDMQLVTDKIIPLGKIKRWNITFEQQGNQYLAAIQYTAEDEKHLVLQVQENGDYKQLDDARDRLTTAFPTEEFNRYGCSLRRNDFLYTIDIDNAKRDSNSIVHFIPGDTCPPGENYQRIRLRKINNATGETDELLIGSTHRQYFHPSLLLTDSAVFMAALSSPLKEDKNAGRGSVLMVRAEQHLEVEGPVSVLAEPSAIIGAGTYRATGMVLIGSKLLLTGNGLVQQERVSYHREPPGGAGMPVQQRTSKWVAQSLQLFLFNLMSDSMREYMLEVKAAHKNLLLDEMLAIPSAGAIDFFIPTNYKGGRTGITHCRLNEQEQFTEEELMVDTRNSYDLASAKAVAPGLLVVPYLRQGHYGLLGVSY